MPQLWPSLQLMLLPKHSNHKTCSCKNKVSSQHLLTNPPNSVVTVRQPANMFGTNNGTTLSTWTPLVLTTTSPRKTTTIKLLTLTSANFCPHRLLTMCAVDKKSILVFKTMLTPTAMPLLVILRHLSVNPLITMRIIVVLSLKPSLFFIKLVIIILLKDMNAF